MNTGLGEMDASLGLENTGEDSHCIDPPNLLPQQPAQAAPARGGVGAIPTSETTQFYGRNLITGIFLRPWTRAERKSRIEDQAAPVLWG